MGKAPLAGTRAEAPVLTDDVLLVGDPGAPHPQVHEPQQQEEEAGGRQQEHGQVVGAEPPGGGHPVPTLELLQQLVLGDGVLVLAGVLAVAVQRVVGVGDGGPVGAGQGAVVGEARSQADAEAAAG